MCVCVCVYVCLRGAADFLPWLFFYSDLNFHIKEVIKDHPSYTFILQDQFLEVKTSGLLPKPSSFLLAAHMQTGSLSENYQNMFQWYQQEFM